MGPASGKDHPSMSQKRVYAWSNPWKSPKHKVCRTPLLHTAKSRGHPYKDMLIPIGLISVRPVLPGCHFRSKRSLFHVSLGGQILQELADMKLLCKGEYSFSLTATDKQPDLTGQLHVSSVMDSTLFPQTHDSFGGAQGRQASCSCFSNVSKRPFVLKATIAPAKTNSPARVAVLQRLLCLFWGAGSAEVGFALPVITPS